MSALAAIVVTLAVTWALLATAWRLRVWWQTPSPLPIPLAPAPRSRWAVAARLLLELVCFRSLARASIATWVPAILFHYGLLIVLIVHLRLLFPTLPLWLLPFLRVSGWAALAMIVGLGLLLARRILVDRVRRISAPSDYLHVVLLLGIALSGVLLKRVWPVDLFNTGAFLRGALSVDWQPLPAHAGLWVHLGLVIVLLVIFPISKLVHAPGVAFAPTFHQRDPRVAGNRARGSSEG